MNTSLAHRLAIIGITLTLLFLYTGCTSTPVLTTEFDIADLMGVVYDGRARSVQDYMLTIDNQIIISSDVNGRFTIPALKNGHHKIKGSKPGYETLDMDIDFAHRTQFLYLTSNSLLDYLNDAELALAKKDYIIAQSNVTLALAIDGNNEMALYMQALIYNNLNDTAKAYDIIQKLFSQNVKEEAIYLLLLDIAKNNVDLRPKIVADFQSNPALMANPRLKIRLEKISSANK